MEPSATSHPETLTRRTFLAGVGSVSVGLLFRRKLDRVLAELEAESESELEATPAAAEITCSPQHAFRPERLIVPATITPFFVIENITIGGVPQFLGDNVPAEMFSPGVMDNAIDMDAVTAGTEIKFRVRYVGNKPRGEIFIAALIGSVADQAGGMRVIRTVLPISSGVAITA